MKEDVGRGAQMGLQLQNLGVPVMLCCCDDSKQWLRLPKRQLSHPIPEVRKLPLCVCKACISTMRLLVTHLSPQRTVKKECAGSPQERVIVSVVSKIITLTQASQTEVLVTFSYSFMGGNTVTTKYLFVCFIYTLLSPIRIITLLKIFCPSLCYISSAVYSFLMKGLFSPLALLPYFKWCPKAPE